MTDTQRQLLQAIITNPDEDSVRLEFADCIHEQGEEDRAEFIRVQVELAKKDAERARLIRAFHWCFDFKKQDEWRHAFSERCECEYCLCCSQQNELRSRERELFTWHNIQKWFRENGPVFDRHTTSLSELCELRDAVEKCGITACLVSRGFISHVTYSAEDLFAHADELIWNGKMTDECPGCKGCGDISTLAGRHGCYQCAKSHIERGTGRIRRSCPDTAQPIQKVTLTDDPRDIPGWEDEFRSVLRAEDGKCIWRCRKFPGIEFQFPVYGISNANVPQINPEGGLIVDYESHTQEDIDGFDGW